MTLVPSLVAAWPDPHWQRPAAAGRGGDAGRGPAPAPRPAAAGWRGAGALDALHESAPHVAQVLDVVPRWAFPALAVLLLAVGATYEQRLRDARRMRESLGRMR